MVQFLLKGAGVRHLRLTKYIILGLLLVQPGWAASKPKTTQVEVPELLLEGGRKLSFERWLAPESFDSEGRQKLSLAALNGHGA